MSTVKDEAPQAHVDEYTLGVDTFHVQIGYLEGKILTIADASFGDTEQRKAVKDLIKRMFREQRNHVDKIVYGYGSDAGNEKVAQDPLFDN